ncbi:MAG: anti-sigma factor [Proteobacteria bacterium]|nr:anti-sigma factor [Pseudomonadota bacterium]
MTDRTERPSDEPADEALGALIRRHATRHEASTALQSSVRAEIALLAAARAPAPAPASPPAPARVPASTSRWAAWAGAARASWQWLAGGAASGALVTAALMAWVVVPMLRGPDDGLANELVAGHVRALMLNHLSDVVSTDQHTVKPWFQGKLAYAPPVEDFVADGFPLVGGRLDYADGQPVAALVYHRRGHIINLFVMPTAAAHGADCTTTTRRGFHVDCWQGGGMEFWAVSDVSVDELALFAKLWQQRLPGR